MPRPLALVTGASQGIGAAIARELSRRGYDLILTARDTARLELVARDIKEARVIAADLSQPGSVNSLLREIGKPLDVLINNAGAGYSVPFAESDPARQSALLQLNIAAVTELTRAVLPAMLSKRQGRILFVASLAAFLPGPGAATYHASKAYVRSFGEALSYELHGTGVTSTVVCPGPTATGYWDGADATNTRVGRGGLMTAEAVAAISCNAMLKGKRLVVAGASNKLSSIAVSFLPRPMVLAMSAKLNTAADS